MQSFGNIPAIPEHRAAAPTYFARITALLKDGKVALLPVRAFGGLDSVWDAMEEMKAGKVTCPRELPRSASNCAQVSGERIAFKVFEGKE